jgi:hypothetical protein
MHRQKSTSGYQPGRTAGVTGGPYHRQCPYITLTDFEKNTIRAVPVPEDELEPTGPFPSDSAEFVAEKIVQGILSGEAEIYSHDWMKERRT